MKTNLRKRIEQKFYKQGKGVSYLYFKLGYVFEVYKEVVSLKIKY